MGTLSIHNASTLSLSTKSAAEVRSDLSVCREIALLDVREEAAHAEGHPLFAANLPLSRIELEAPTRLPRRNTPIVVFDADNDHRLAQRAAERLLALGYRDVRLLADGLEGWRHAGYELFRDVNAPSKAFGELVEARKLTPSLSAQEVKAQIDANANIVILDVRRFDEFHTMSIPTATSVPGAELVLRVRELAPDPATRVIVNCAGRTRSIIGAQSLINAGLPNPVTSLRNGTIGWTLANQRLDHGAARKFREVSPEQQATAAASARRVADKAGVSRIDLPTLSKWNADDQRTLYRFDVRTPEEYVAGHLPGFLNAPGGQLVQETDFFAPVRGARIVLADNDGVRANMTASWLAQMAWEVAVIDGVRPDEFSEHGTRHESPELPSVPEDAWIGPSQLHDWLQEQRDEAVTVLDFAPSRVYAQRHIPGSWFALRSQLAEALQAAPAADRYVLTSPDSTLAHLAWPEATPLASRPVRLLIGGTDAWIVQGFKIDSSGPKYAAPPIDRYRRPYEGTDATPAAMQGYLDWEHGLVEQLHRDGTHRFFVI
jgi:rhodanese-related sulfurtransferase